MYAGTFNKPEKATLQRRHSYKQKFGDLWSQPAQNDFPSILSKH